MKENKNIERLFQEKFKQFEATPPPVAWQNIQAKLETKKKKTRVFPIWLRNSGIAASIVLSGLIGYQIKSNSIATDLSKDTIVITEKERITPVEETINTDLQIFEKNTNDELIVRQTKNDEDLLKTENSISNKTIGTKNNPVSDEINYQDSQIVVQSDKKNTNELNNKYSDENKSIGSKNNSNSDEKNYQNSQVIVQSDKKNTNELNNKNSDENKDIGTKNNPFIDDKKYHDSQIIVQSDKKNNDELNNENSTANKTIGTKNNSISDEKNYHDSQIIVQSDKKNNDELNNENSDENKSIGTKNNSISDEINYQNSQVIVQSDKKNTNELNNKNSDENKGIGIKNNSISDRKYQLASKISEENSVISAISKPVATQDKEPITNDSTTVIIADAIAINPLEQLRLQMEEGKIAVEKDEKVNKWAVSTHATAVYFNSATEGSSLDTQFNENAKSYNSSLGYGVGLQYKLSKRLYLKTGVSNLALSYDTNDVNYKTEFGSVSKNVNTISRSKQGENILLTNKNSRIETNDVENFNQNKNAVLSQKMGYIEVPLELNYKVLDKQVSVFFVGGLSTLFLSSNSVSLIDNESEITIGKANNLNPVHFSTNLGLGVTYRIMKDFNFNFQPMFKYQLNSLNANDNSFKPYYVGLNSGISYSF